MYKCLTWNFNSVVNRLDYIFLEYIQNKIIIININTSIEIIT